MTLIRRLVETRLGSSVAVGLVGLVFLMGTLADYERLSSLYQPLTRSVLAIAVLSLVVGWIAQLAWLLALAIFALLTANWLSAVRAMFSLPDPTVARPNQTGRA